jgi:hypothetical protein
MYVHTYVPTSLILAGQHHSVQRQPAHHIPTCCPPESSPPPTPIDKSSVSKSSPPLTLLHSIDHELPQIYRCDQTYYRHRCRQRVQEQTLPCPQALYCDTSRQDHHLCRRHCSRHCFNMQSNCTSWIRCSGWRRRGGAKGNDRTDWTRDSTVWLGGVWYCSKLYYTMLGAIFLPLQV